MTNKILTFAPPAVLLAGVLLVSGIREQYQVESRAPMSAVQAEFSGYRGKDIVIDTAEQRIAGMSDYAMRAFGPDSAYLFSTYVGYYDRQVQGKSIHSPKNCLPGAGWEIMTNERKTIQSPIGPATVNRVILANNGVRALVYYWYQGRGRIEASEYRVKWDLLRDAALYGRTEEALVRIIVPIERGIGTSGPEVARADSLAAEVAKPLIVSVDNVLPLPPKA
jgi:EpsI family protein